MWSPMRMVFSIEPLGISRLCAIALSTKNNARISHTHERISRTTFWRVVFSGGTLFELAGWESAGTMGLHFQLHKLGGICAGVAGGAEMAFVVFDGGAQAFEREIAERISANEFANLFDGISRGDQFRFCRRIHAVMAR